MAAAGAGGERKTHTGPYIYNDPGPIQTNVAWLASAMSCVEDKSFFVLYVSVNVGGNGSGWRWWREEDPYWPLRDWGDHPMRWWTWGLAAALAGERLL
jgi:hypothetical protein